MAHVAENGCDQEWVHCRLADACSAINYGLTASATDTPTGPKFLRITDIVSGVPKWDSVPYVSAEESEQEKYQLFNGDIVVARTGASTGVSAFIKDPPQALFASYLVRLQTKPEFDPRFVSYYLKSEEFWTFIRGVLGDKSAQPNASASTMTSAPFRAPRNLSDQQAIAHILGTLDDKIELNRRTNQTLEEMARAIFQDWFVDFGPTRAKTEGLDPYLPPELWDLFPDELVDSELGEIPEGWEVKSLGDLSHKPQYGYTASASPDPISGPKFLRITDINKTDWIEWETVPHCDIRDEDIEKYRLYQNDILIARMADPGHGCMIEEKLEAVFASYLIRFRPKRQLHARFLQFWLRSNQYWNLVRERGTGTTRTSLNAKVLGDFDLVVPAEPLVEAFGDQARRLRERVVANVNESAILATQRDTMLPKLLSGEFQTEPEE